MAITKAYRCTDPDRCCRAELEPGMAWVEWCAEFCCASFDECPCPDEVDEATWLHMSEETDDDDDD